MLAWAEEESGSSAVPRERRNSSWKRQMNPSPVRSGSPSKKSFGRKGGDKWTNGLWGSNGGDKQIFASGNTNGGIAGNGFGSGIARTSTPPPLSPSKLKNNYQFPSKSQDRAQVAATLWYYEYITEVAVRNLKLLKLCRGRRSRLFTDPQIIQRCSSISQMGQLIRFL